MTTRRTDHEQRTASEAGPGIQRKRMTNRRRELLWGLIFMSPWIVGFLIFMAGPMLWSLWLSFTDYDPLVAQTNFIGVSNYQDLFGDRQVRISLWNTIFFTIFNVPGTIISGLVLALMLDRIGRAAGFFRTVFYLPNITPAVAVGALFLLLLNGRDGIVNQALRALGMPGPSWLNDPAWIKPGIILMMLWSVGSTVIIYFAALRNVPQVLYEAARVDGASAWQQFRSITVPMISGAIFFTLVINTIASLQLFTEVYAMFFGTQQSGAAGEAALFYVIYLFRNAFEFFNMGYASALAWLLFAVIGLITLIQVKTSKRWVYYEAGD
ncbi:MAG: sugar ABC transporter permease [Euzebyales bacterium]|nr:sugar ABC transporter permease [Euzebyales bacterium]MBA3621353.1 sugar ABC transporter permease [Euzebyales bacterium]